MRKQFVLLLALSLMGCLESQPAPDVEDIPSTDFRIETISDKLRKPWGVAALPDGGYLVTELAGTMKYIDGETQTEILGVPENIYVAGQGGLMGIALAPDFETSKEVFLAYAYGTKKANGTAVFKARLENNRLVDGVTIFKANPPKDTSSHFGGRIVFMPDDSFVLSLGDGFAYREDALAINSHLGKIVRLGRDGKSKENYLSIPKGLDGIYSVGHRNVQGLAYDAPSGNLWAHEHGPRGGDELNLIKAGANYGWPLATTGTDYSGAKISPFKTHPRSEPFVYDWVPSIAPSGLAIYRGNMFPDWQGDAFVGALVGKSLWRIDLEGTEAIGESRMLGDLNGRVRDVSVDRDGALLVLIEAEMAGKLIRVLPKN